MDDARALDGWRRVTGSVRVRITTIAMVAFALAFTAAAFALVGAVRTSMEDALRADNDVMLARIRGQLEAGERVTNLLVGSGEGVSWQIVGDGEQVLAGSSGLAAAPQGVMAPAGGGVAVRSIAKGAPGQLVDTAEVSTGAGKVTVAVASPLDDVRRSVDAIVHWLRIGVPVLTLLIGALVWVLVRRALRPVETIRHEVEEISHGTLHRRVPVPESHDEVARLAGTMNDMLDRLEGASDRQREFVSDASHELRSPLTTMRATLEVAPDALTDPDWEAMRTDLLAENRRMEVLVAALLELARSDEPIDEVHAPPVEVADVVAEEVARRRAIEVTFVAGDHVAAVVRGSHDALGRAVGNLLDNAAQHGAQHVAVTLSVDGDDLVVTVDDDGPGIPPAERQRVFERFTRLGDDRSRDDGGSGLGLAIVAAVVARHRGSVVVHDAPLGGARVVVRLPRASREAASPARGVRAGWTASE